MTAFCLYGDNVWGRIGLHDLLARAKAHQMFHARVEHGASEGYDCEVAIWNDDAKQWQRFAFLNCLGGEFKPGLDAEDTAAALAGEINYASQAGKYSPLISRMPDYNPQPIAKATLWPNETQVTVGEHRSTITGDREFGAWTAIKLASENGASVLEFRIENHED